MRAHQQELHQHQLKELAEPLAMLNSHNTSCSKQQISTTAPQSANLRPSDLSVNQSSLSNTIASQSPFLNCNNLSPPQQKSPRHQVNDSTNNANWNSDSWADGEFEPIDEPMIGKSKAF